MVLYFNGTGNSRYVAKIIAEKSKDDLISMNELMKTGKKEELSSPDKPFVFVCPTYAWRIPRVVTEFIRSATFTGSRKVYFLMTCGDDTANAIGYIKELCEFKGFELQGFAEIIMPENYITMYSAPEKAVAKEIIEKSTPFILKLAENIQDGKVFDPFTAKAKVKSGLVNTAFYGLVVKAKGFHATDKCISCSKCVKLCPLNNIEMSGSKPAWNNKCTHCMACICGCPATAIEYKNKTQGKTRYYLDTF